LSPQPCIGSTDLAALLGYSGSAMDIDTAPSEVQYFVSRGCSSHRKLSSIAGHT
jgi:hypothetical protein